MLRSLHLQLGAHKHKDRTALNLLNIPSNLVLLTYETAIVTQKHSAGAGANTHEGEPQMDMT